MNYLDIANGGLMWAAAIPTVASVILISIKFMDYSKSEGRELGMTDKDFRTAFRVGSFATIGPAMANFTVMVALMAVLGGPLAWLRLSILGAAPTEMVGAAIGAASVGAEMGTGNYDLMAFSASAWTMTLNTVGWVVVVFFLTHRMENVKVKLSKIDDKILTIVGVGALVGALSMFASLYGFHSGKSSGIAVVVAMVSAVLINLLAKKVTKLNEFNVGISMLAGMLVAQAFV